MKRKLAHLPLRSPISGLRLRRQRHHKSAAMTTSADLLFSLRESFYLGAYQVAINSSDIPSLPADDALERDVIVHRSHIALGSYKLVIDEIDSSAPTSLQAVKLLSIYLSGSKEDAISSIQELLSDAATCNNPVLRLIAGIIYMHERDYDEALEHTNAGGTMELHALNVQIYITMHRLDCAEEQLKIMQQIDEDHVLTQLANAWLDLAAGGSKIEEAYLIYQDLSEKYQMTGTILNGKAVCCMRMGRFDEAESLLVEALNKDTKDAAALANLAVCSLHRGKTSTTFLDQLKLLHPLYVLARRLVAPEGNLDKALESSA